MLGWWYDVERLLVHVHINKITTTLGIHRVPYDNQRKHQDIHSEHGEYGNDNNMTFEVFHKAFNREEIMFLYIE